MASQRATTTTRPAGAPGVDVVLVPVKDFGAAKARLSEALTPPRRATLARAMAARVISAGSPAPVWVVCDDPVVARFALEHGAEVCWTPGRGLNGAVGAALERAAEAGHAHAVIAHADLPFARSLSSLVVPGCAVIVPDRHLDGTNVMAVPTGVGFRPSYGARSSHRHAAEARRLGLEVRTVDDPRLAWDVDTEADLWPPPDVGRWPDELPRPAPAEPCRAAP